MGAGSNLSNGALGRGRRGRVYTGGRGDGAPLWRVGVATLLVFAGNTLAFVSRFFF